MQPEFRFSALTALELPEACCSLQAEHLPPCNTAESAHIASGCGPLSQGVAAADG